MPKRKDWKNLLNLQEKKDNARILTIIPEKTNRELRIDFMCNCGEKYNKGIRKIVEKSGLFCKKCTNTNSKNKQLKTNIKLYGVSNPSKNKNVKNKMINTIKNKSIEEKKLINKKISDTKMNKSIEEKKLINNKKIKTSFKNWGVRNPSMCKEIHSKKKKTSFSTKEYKFKTGEIEFVQGYEPFALKILEEQGYQYKDIKIEYMTINYIFGEKKCVHLPDIYIPKENIIIEVKSTRTYDLHKERNIQKQLYAMAQGYIYYFWIFDYKGKLIIY